MMNLRTMFVFLALSTAVCALADAAKPTYPLTVHVGSSDFSVSCNSNYTCYGLQKLNVTIDGKKYILASENAAIVTGIGQYYVYVLRDGDYPGRIVKEDTTDTGEYHRVVELQLAGGAGKRYTVVGEGAN